MHAQVSTFPEWGSTWQSCPDEPEGAKEEVEVVEETENAEWMIWAAADAPTYEVEEGAAGDDTGGDGAAGDDTGDGPGGADDGVDHGADGHAAPAAPAAPAGPDGAAGDGIPRVFQHNAPWRSGHSKGGNRNMKNKGGKGRGGKGRGAKGKDNKSRGRGGRNKGKGMGWQHSWNADHSSGASSWAHLVLSFFGCTLQSTKKVCWNSHLGLNSSKLCRSQAAAMATMLWPRSHGGLMASAPQRLALPTALRAKWPTNGVASMSKAVTCTMAYCFRGLHGY